METNDNIFYVKEDLVFESKQVDDFFKFGALYVKHKVIAVGSYVLGESFLIFTN